MAIIAGIVFLAIVGVWFYSSNYMVWQGYKEKKTSKADAIFLYVIVNSVGLAAIFIVASSIYLNA